MDTETALDLLRTGQDEHRIAYIYLKSGNSIKLTDLSSYSFETLQLTEIDKMDELIKMEKQKKVFLMPSRSTKKYVDPSQIEAINFCNQP